MMSKISFSKLVRDEIRKMNWLLALQFLVLLLLIPFRVLMVLAASRSNGYLSWSGKTMYELFCENVGLGHYENTVIIMGMGIICALAAFYYLHSACQLDFYHSLAVKREKLFAAKYLGGFLTFMLPYAAAQLLAIPAGGCYGAFSCKATLEILIATVQGTLFFLCSYSGTLIAVMLTGKLLTSILALGILGCYVPMLCMVYMGYRVVFFYTRLSAAGLEKWIENVIRYSSPWVLCVHGQSLTFPSDVIRGATGKWPTPGGMLLILAVTAVLTGIALLLYRGRKTEAAGQALAFRPLEAVVKLMLTIPTAALASLLAYELMDSVLWETVFILLFGMLACMIMEFIYRWDIRQVLCHRMHILITVAAALVLFFSCRFDLFGYNTYLPKEDSIKAMAVGIGAGYMQHLYLDEDGLTWGYGAENCMKMLEGTETEDFGNYYRLAENGVDKIKAGEEMEYEDGAVYVEVKYSLTNGKEVYREYLVDEELVLEVFNELQKNPEFLEQFYPIMTWSRENMASFGEAGYYREGLDEEEESEYETEEGGYDYDDEYYGTLELADPSDGEYYQIPHGDIERVVEAYRQDLLDVSVSFEDSLFRYGGSCLNFELPARGSGEGEGFYIDTYYINEKFVHTMAALEDILEGEEPS